MNKFLVIISLLFLSISCKNETKIDSQFKSDFYTGCMQSIKASAGDLYNFELSKDYCNCVTETVLPQLNDEEIKQISTENNQKVQEKINTLVDPCLQDYLNKSKSLE